MKHVHLIGIGGTGISAIARLLLESGYTVTGSDRQLSLLAKSLQEAGVRVYTGHQVSNIQGADVVVRSSAVPDNNPEVQAALAAGIPVLKRADFLGQLMIGKTGIAVAGSHGKTTTTAMIAWMLSWLAQDPSYIIGSVSKDLGANAHAGQGPTFVIEADEYDRMFLGLRPKIEVVTNVEHDHPDCFPTLEDYHAAFLEFTERLEPGGLLLSCSEDVGATRLLKEAAGRGLQTAAYGFTEPSDSQFSQQFLARDLQSNASGGFTFRLFSEPGVKDEMPQVILQVPGRHNVLNATAALAVAHRLGLPLADAARALSRFTGTGRRFEVVGQAGGVTVIDDYAHHPTEIRATLAAARARYPRQQIWAVWQPHTYSRTRSLFEQFAAAFKDADHVLVTEVYPAREPVDPNFSSRQVVETMHGTDVHYAATLRDAAAFLLSHLRPGSVLLVLSAGDADQVSAQVLSQLNAMKGNGK